MKQKLFKLVSCPLFWGQVATVGAWIILLLAFVGNLFGIYASVK